MRNIKLFVDIGFCGCGGEEIIQVEDSISDEELQEWANEFAMQYAASWEGDERLGDWDEDSTESFFENVCGWWEEVEDE